MTACAGPEPKFPPFQAPRNPSQCRPPIHTLVRGQSPFGFGFLAHWTTQRLLVCSLSLLLARLREIPLSPGTMNPGVTRKNGPPLMSITRTRHAVRMVPGKPVSHRMFPPRSGLYFLRCILQDQLIVFALRSQCQGQPSNHGTR